MKRSIYTGLMVGALGMGLATADVKLDSTLTIKGFLDMSTTIPGTKNLNGEFDQFEVDFLYKLGDHISARADINALPGAGGPGAAVYFEQAYVKYTEGAASVSAGKFLSVSGFEAAEPTDTYQQSYNDAINNTYGGYENGLNVAYAADKFALYGAVVSSIWNSPPGIPPATPDYDFKKPGIEAQVALMPTAAITAKVTYMFEDHYKPVDTIAATDKQVINAWVSYTMGSLLVAGEYDYIMNNTAKSDNGNGWMAMANYKFTDKWVGTVRYSGITTDLGGKGSAGFTFGPKKVASEVSICPTYYISGNWWVLAEFREEIGAKKELYGAETTLTF